MSGTHIKGPLTVGGVEVISAAGAITADVQATAGSIGSAELADNTIKTVSKTLTSAEIVGTSAGDIGATAGAELVAAPGAGKIIEFVSAILSYDYDTAAYTGGGDDLVIRQGTTAMTAPIAKADLLADTEDDIAYVNALSAGDIKVTANSALNLFAGTAYTQPGTAAGVLRVVCNYRIHSI